MLIEGIERKGMEVILGLATFWSQPGITRWAAERLEKDPNAAEEETYRVMASKSEIIYRDYDRANFYKAKAAIAANKSRLIKAASSK